MSVSPQSETGLKQEDEGHGLTLEPTNRIIQEDPQHSGGAKELKKVRTGCLTCKLRKVKCDETKPVCLRCAQGGRPCQGYPAIPPRAKRSKQKRSSNWSLALKLAPRGDGGAGDPSASDLSPDMLSPGFITSPTSDKSALVIFRCRTAPRLSTFMDKHFWTELVLQMGDEEPAVLHALTALNFVYDFYEADGMNNLMPMKSRLKSPTYTKGLRAFNQGISELLERPSQLQHDNESVHLVCCIIFVCIEMLCTEHWAAMVHFDRGTKLLETLMLDQTGETGASSGHRKVVREVLLPMFRRLNIHASILGKNNAIFDSFPPLLQADGSGVSYPYKDLTSSTDALFTLLDAGLRQVNLLVGFNQLEFGILEGLSGHPDLLDQVLEHQRRSMAGFAEWLAGFSPLSTAIAVSPSADPQEKLCCWTLRAYHMVSEIWGMEVLAQNECTYDKHLDKFATVVHIASNSLQLQKAVGEKQAMPVFSFELGMLTPLYFTLWRCRQRRVRKAAWTLMRDWPKKENFWCPQLAALAGKLLLTTEDPGAFEPGNETVDYWPPEEDRLHKATITHEFHDDEPTTIHMTLHRKPHGLNGEWEIIRRSARMGS